MAIAEAYSGTNGTWGTEYSLTGAGTTLQTQTTDGVYQLFLDLNAVALGDTYEIRCYEKARSADTQRVVQMATVSHAQGADGALYYTEPIVLMHGWDYSLKRTAGSDRTITWSIRSVT
jgi:hypothetical protein